MVKNPVVKRPGFNPWVGKIPWRREWQPTPVFLSEKSHGQRSLVGDSPGVTKESDTTEQLSNSNILVYYLDIRTIWRYCIVSFKSQ